MKKILAVILVFLLSVGSVVAVFAENEDISSAREQYNQAKEKYMKLRNALPKTLEAWRAFKVRDKFGKIKNIRPTDEQIERIKEMYKARCDLLIRQLENLIVYVKNHDFEDKESALEAIDAGISKIKALKERIDSVQTIEELRQLYKELLEQWKEHRVLLKKYTGFLISNRLHAAHERAVKQFNRISDVIQKLKDAGYETDKYEKGLAEIKAGFDLVMEKYQLAKEKFQAINDVDDAVRLYKEATELIREGNKILRENCYKLRNLLKDLKEDIRNFRADAKGGA